MYTLLLQAELRNSTDSDRYWIDTAGQMHNYSHQHVLFYQLFNSKSSQKCQNYNFSRKPIEYINAAQLFWLSEIKIKAATLQAANTLAIWIWCMVLDETMSLVALQRDPSASSAGTSGSPAFCSLSLNASSKWGSED